MKYFDIKNFEENIKGKNIYRFTDPNGNEILQLGDKISGYAEKNTPSNSNITYIYSFYPNGKLWAKVKEFKGAFFYGEKFYYDQNGKYISKENLDKDFKISIEDVRQKILSEFGLDIFLKSSEVDLRRYAGTKPHLKVTDTLFNLYWVYVLVPTDEQPYLFTEIEIDADTGKELGRVLYQNNGMGNNKDYLEKIQEYRKMQEKENAISSNYKTYEGKNYSRKEWEVFEQKQFEIYARKHNIVVAKNNKKETNGFTSRFLLDD